MVDSRKHVMRKEEPIISHLTKKVFDFNKTNFSQLENYKKLYKKMEITYSE